MFQKQKVFDEVARKLKIIAAHNLIESEEDINILAKEIVTYVVREIEKAQEAYKIDQIR